MLSSFASYTLLESLPPHWGVKPPAQVAHILVDASVMPLLIMTTYKKVLFFYKALPLLCRAWRLHLGEVLQRLTVRKRQKVVKETKKVKKTKAFPASAGALEEGEGCTTEDRRFFVRTFAVKNAFGKTTDNNFGTAHCPLAPHHHHHHFWTSVLMREHAQLLVDLVHFNRHFASPLIFWHFVPALYGSVFLLCLLYFFPVELPARLVMTILYFLLFVSFILLSGLSAVVKTLYGNGVDRQLFKVQMNCCGCCAGENRKRSAHLRVKLKLMAYYEVLRTRKKVAFTFGSHAKLERKWLWEVSGRKISISAKQFKFY